MIELILYRVSNYIKSKNYTEYLKKNTNNCCSVIWLGNQILLVIHLTPTCKMNYVNMQHDFSHMSTWLFRLLTYSYCISTYSRQEGSRLLLTDWSDSVLRRIAIFKPCNDMSHVNIYTSNTLSCMYCLSNGIEAKSCSFNHLFWKYSRL